MRLCPVFADPVTYIPGMYSTGYLLTLDSLVFEMLPGHCTSQKALQ